MTSTAFNRSYRVLLCLAALLVGAPALMAQTTLESVADPGTSDTTQGGSGPGGPCGGVAGHYCDEGLLCVVHAIGFCDFQDLQGVCTELPCPSTLEPVCGCDENTYDNICLAALNGTFVDHEGACEGFVPATSPVGVVALSLLLLIAGTATLVLRRRGTARS